MNETVFTETIEKVKCAILYLERMAAGQYPISAIPVEADSDLNKAEVVRSLYYILDVIKMHSVEMKKMPEINRKTMRKFPVECLEEFAYEGDKSITQFVSQLKALAGDPKVKGMNTKRISDWLKENNYLQEIVDPDSGDKRSIITENGEAVGMYPQKRHTRFGQEYEVIIYSEKAQYWLVEKMPIILGNNK